MNMLNPFGRRKNVCQSRKASGDKEAQAVQRKGLCSTAGFLCHFLLALAGATGVSQTLAQTFPDKTKVLRLVVPAGAGSATDILARAYSQAITEVSELKVVVENRPGANSVIGITSVLAAPPDGYSMLITSATTLTLGPFVVEKLPFAPLTDLAPLAGVSNVDLILNVGPSTPFKSARELIASARANPGKHTCASASAASTISCELLMSTTKVKLLVVPYKTTAAALTAVAAGEADILITDMSSSSFQWAGGRVRPIAVTGSARMSARSDLPTLSEDGAPGYEMTNWFATFYSAQTPEQVRTAMIEILKRAAKTKTVQETLATFAMTPLDSYGATLATRARNETDKWDKLIRANGIKLY